MKLREFWHNWMGMDNSLDAAKVNTPKAEHEDLRCYVEKSAFNAAVAVVVELQSKLKMASEALKKFEEIEGMTISYDPPCKKGHSFFDAIDNARAVLGILETASSVAEREEGDSK